MARAVAQHLGTDHTELYVRTSELAQVVPRLPAIYDEPFADSSQIPTVLLCELARSQVTVSLSGDAGDELFGGYADYGRAQRLWPLIDRIPCSLRRRIARPLGSLAGWGSRLVTRPPAMRHLAGRVTNLAKVLPAASDRSFYRMMMSPNREPLTWLACKDEPPTRFDEVLPWESFPDLLSRMMYLDFVSYLPDDILVKVDRAAMAVSLETRIPLLDHRVIEYAWSLPYALKQRHGQGKWLLRQVLHRYVPPSLVERPKKGFNVPLGEWLRGPLRDWAEALLSGARLREEGFFAENTVLRNWRDHLSGERDLSPALWPVLVFQAWLEEQGLAKHSTEENSPVVLEAEEAYPASNQAGGFKLPIYWL